MKCSRCGKRESVIELRYFKERLCKECFLKLFEKRVMKNISRNKLLKKDDRVAVGLSGGKDSLVTLYLLHMLSKKAPKSALLAITIDEGIRGCRSKAVKNAKGFCKDVGVECYSYSFKGEFGLTMDEIVKKSRRGNGPPPCTYCGVLRRRLLNDKARELKVDKIATGHNLDDEIQVSMMNFIRGDLQRIARMGALVGFKKDKRFVPRIKPLRECPEKEVALYAILKELPVSFDGCPYTRDAFRNTIRDAINDIEDKHPGSKFQLLRSTDEFVGIIKKAHIRGAIGKCLKCGEPSSGDICKACQIIESLT